MSQHASTIARLLDEARQLEAQAYTYTTQLRDPHLNDTGRQMLTDKLLLAEQQHLDKHAEINRLRALDEKQAEAGKQQLSLF